MTGPAMVGLPNTTNTSRETSASLVLALAVVSGLAYTLADQGDASTSLFFCQPSRAGQALSSDIFC